MNDTITDDRLEALQSGRFLAELDWDPDACLLTITVAGPPGVTSFDLYGVRGLAFAYESLDPITPPAALTDVPRLDAGSLAEWEPDRDLEGRLRPLDEELVRDLSVASSIDWILGSDEVLAGAPFAVGFRIEAWTYEPHPADLDLLVVCDGVAYATEDEDCDLGAFRLQCDEVTPPSTAASTPHPDEPPFDLDPHDLPDDLAAAVRAFFEAAMADDWRRLAAVHPSLDRSRASQEAWLARHFHDTYDWSYARHVDAWWCAGDLACAVVRGVSHTPAEDSMPARNEECVWALSLRRSDQGWIVRHWSQSWPGWSDPAATPDAADAPWRARWSSEPLD